MGAAPVHDRRNASQRSGRFLPRLMRLKIEQCQEGQCGTLIELSVWKIQHTQDGKRFGEALSSGRTESWSAMSQHFLVYPGVNGFLRGEVMRANALPESHQGGFGWVTQGVQVLDVHLCMAIKLSKTMVDKG